ncbi:DUF983 domain-containing protein [Chenggangzhangella methanolivorans]|uniref:DUF983 domain-containing protein n=1 Tax=Chenggangzhangella methanolivorans TaxID=1437009 RepID=A0A9E6RAU8_9HYPH|nr:DUF983 domain-containing protein [Chenggangzhangella methanolivorans]QZN99948.1 DUF983 domain-containing protein [Chenggangzhangella methanolivorans]
MSVDYAHGSEAEADPPARPIWRSMRRGAVLRCPACGEGRMFSAYLKVTPACASCGEELHHQRADDAPTYIVITIVAHVVVGALLWVEVAYQPPVWLHMAMWLPLTVILSLALLPPVKGALVGLQWALRMHGFGGEDDDMPPDGGLKPEQTQ